MDIVETASHNYSYNDPNGNEITEIDINKLITKRTGVDYTHNDDGT